MDNYQHSELTDKIIRAFFKVYNTLGYGFLEKVYEKSMMIELVKTGFIVESQLPIPVFYESDEVGSYFADLVVERKVIIELKAADGIKEEHEAQLLNYLRATDIEVGLLMNFGKKAEFRKKVFSNRYKNRN